ncbi:hypothetical protein DFH08DRAFT_430380 [Mycena albidolilacea]|uniref:Uncharacterized protein n=1 Tax=Mycena albidolilacea TaxID=1033008 RepID=A0AAD7EDJ5_9AGAR|nr:hypothetical protein DFH08DRAFT_430380 [Mycena albidolilacea]
MEASFLRAQVWGMFLESLTFGVYLVTCGSCYRVFFSTTSRYRGLSERNWPMLLIFLIFFAKTTSSVGIHLYLNLQNVTETDLGQAVHQFSDASRPVNVSKYITILVQTVIASGFFIYRCWIVHHRSWLIVALPLVLWLGAVALMGIVIHVDTSLNIQGFFAISQSRVFGSCFWAFVIAVNIITTGQIAYRICRVDHLKSRSNVQSNSDDSMSPTVQKSSVSLIPGDPMKFPIHVAIESGMIYTTMTLLVFGLFVAHSTAVYIAIGVLVQVIGISFNLIVIHNRPRSQTSFLSELNSVPLQFTSSNLSVPASAIEFAYPKHFMPRRKNRFAGEPEKEDGTQCPLPPSTPGLPQNPSYQSIQ